MRCPWVERLWEQLPSRQKAVLQTLAAQRSKEIYSQTVRQSYRLGPASSVQKALQSLDAPGVVDQYRGFYFLLDPLFAVWIKINQ
ncbi:MAG: hypothetical protein ABSD98_05145 [Candidatus Korobacteraceae bacterium]